MVALSDNQISLNESSPVQIPSRGGVSPIGTVSPNTGSSANTNSTYGQGAFASGITEQTSATSYTVQNTDYQGVIIFNTASAVSVTLNSAVQSNFSSTILNLGAGAITLTPTAGTVNGAGSVTLGAGQGAQIFFANGAWLAYAGTTVVQVVPVNTPAVPHQFFTAYNSTTGVFTEAQPVIGDVSGLTAALALLAPIASPTFTGTVTEPAPAVLTAATTATSATAGAATALPATPLGYLQMSVNGTPVLVPFYSL